jgi:hypothetical protein
MAHAKRRQFAPDEWIGNGEPSGKTGIVKLDANVAITFRVDIRYDPAEFRTWVAGTDVGRVATEILLKEYLRGRADVERQIKRQLAAGAAVTPTSVQSISLGGILGWTDSA